MLEEALEATHFASVRSKGSQETPELVERDISWGSGQSNGSVTIKIGPYWYALNATRV